MSEQWNNDQDRKWEEYVRKTAQGFPYPPTPDMPRLRRPEALPAVRTFTPRRLAQVAAIVLILLGGLFAVPEIRASILEFIRVGVITIFFGGEPTATPTSVPTETQAAQSPAATRRPTSTPTPLASVLDLPGTTTLEDARSRVSFAILLPSYPPDLGEPDRVMVQDVGATMVTLVWLVPGSESDIRLVVQMLDERNIGIKYYNRDDYRETQVRGRRGSWLEQPHIQLFYGQDGEYRRQVTGNVLIWTEDRITYRLEVDAPLDEAVRIAESMQ